MSNVPGGVGSQPSGAGDSCSPFMSSYSHLSHRAAPQEDASSCTIAVITSSKHRRFERPPCRRCLLRWLRTPVLCRVLIVMIAALVFMHALSSVLSFGGTQPRRDSVDVGELLREAATAAPGASTEDHNQSSSVLSFPSKLIPRLIHQTLHSKSVPKEVSRIMRSWATCTSMHWQVRSCSVALGRWDLPQKAALTVAVLHCPDLQHALWGNVMLQISPSSLVLHSEVMLQPSVVTVVQPAATRPISQHQSAACR